MLRACRAADMRSVTPDAAALQDAALVPAAALHARQALLIRPLNRAITNRAACCAASKR